MFWVEPTVGSGPVAWRRPDLQEKVSTVAFQLNGGCSNRKRSVWMCGIFFSLLNSQSIARLVPTRPMSRTLAHFLRAAPASRARLARLIPDCHGHFVFRKRLRYTASTVAGPFQQPTVSPEPESRPSSDLDRDSCHLFSVSGKQSLLSRVLSGAQTRGFTTSCLALLFGSVDLCRKYQENKTSRYLQSWQPFHLSGNCVKNAP